MKFLRRGTTSTDTADEVAEDETAVPVGGAYTARKGRPTPKRRDSQGSRGPAAPPPRTQREAFKRMRENRPDKETARKQRAVAREAMMSGDDRYLMPRDQGPVKAYVRDVVDSRRHLAGLMMPLAALVLVSVFVPVYQVQSMVSLVLMVMMLAILVEGFFLGRQVNAKVRARFPDLEHKSFSLGLYAVMRATQPRKLRTPRPRVKPGSAV